MAFDLGLEGRRTDKRGQFCGATGAKPWRPGSGVASAGLPHDSTCGGRAGWDGSSVSEHGPSALSEAGPECDVPHCASSMRSHVLGHPPWLIAKTEEKTQTFVLGRQAGSWLSVLISVPFAVKANHI